MKVWWGIISIGLVLPIIISATNIESDLWMEGNKEVLMRAVRGTKEWVSGSSLPCRYSKGQWSECDPKNNMRTRTLTIKKGDKTCEQTKIITKKCKKVCRYEKGSWTNCVNQSMVRIDSLKSNSDPSCEKTRRIAKRCKPETNNKKNTKDKLNKKSNKQQQS